jgi:TolB-like protein
MLDSSSLSVAAVCALGGNGPDPGDRRQDHTADEVRLELDRILSSPQFDASERNRRFLDYVVEETLSDRGDRIKAYTIATLVFGRDESFDPALDPVVRMEARRLRRSLERFYLVEGDPGPVRITLPKGGYVPKFQSSALLRSASDEELRRSGARGSEFRRPSIGILPFGMESETACSGIYCDALSRQIAIGLSRYPELAVVLPIPECWSNPAMRLSEARTADFILVGDAIVASSLFKVKVMLLNGSSGEVIWAETLAEETTTDGLFEVRDRMADRMVSALWGRVSPMVELRR